MRQLVIGLLDGATHPAASRHPSPRGDGGRRSIDNQRNAVAHPLLERGEGTASGRSDSEAVNKSEGRGVSHNHYKDIVFLSQGHYKDIVFFVAKSL